MKARTTYAYDGPPGGMIQSSQEALHLLTGHVRTTADRPRRLLDARHRGDLLRELGRLRYDARHSGQEPDRASVGRLIEQLDTDRSEDAVGDEASDGTE